MPPRSRKQKAAEENDGNDGKNDTTEAPQKRSTRATRSRSTAKEDDDEPAPKRARRNPKLNEEEGATVQEVVAGSEIKEDNNHSSSVSDQVNNNNIDTVDTSREQPTINAQGAVEKGSEQQENGEKEDELKTNVEDEEEEDEEDEYFENSIVQSTAPAVASDLYLDTVNRTMLDFDFERLCSVTVSNINIYACLICGKYFQGRSKKSPAYAHSIHDDHHVYINLDTLKVYILPDLYEVNDPSLEDIRYLLAPTFTPELLTKLNNGLTTSTDLQKQPYVPGFIGLNNIKNNSYMNVILQVLLHVPSLRDYLILNSQSTHSLESDSSSKSSSPSLLVPPSLDSSAINTIGFRGKSELIHRFGLLARKIWNPKLFKPQVSPHEFLQEVVSASGKKFRITEAGDPLEFLTWLLNSIHNDLGGNRKDKSSMVFSSFRGEMKIEEQTVVITPDKAGQKPKFDLDRDIKTTQTHFLYLTLDLPPTPVFKDSSGKIIIPEVSLQSILEKYDGVTTTEWAGTVRRYKITRLPQFLIFHMKRFTNNRFTEEKNPTIVNFPLRGVDMSNCLENPNSEESTVYDLLSNITHSSTAGTAREDSTWKVHVHTSPQNHHDEKWFQIQDLIVEEIQKQTVFLSESYIQIWARRDKSKLGINKKVVTPDEKIKSTKSRVAALEMARKNEVGFENTYSDEKKTKPGVNMGKVRVEKGDSGSFEI